MSRYFTERLPELPVRTVTLIQYRSMEISPIKPICTTGGGASITRLAINPRPGDTRQRKKYSKALLAHEDSIASAELRQRFEELAPRYVLI